MLGNSVHLPHRTEQVELSPLFDYPAALVKAVYLDARELQPMACASNAKELPLVGAANRPAAHNLVTFGYLIFYGAGQVGEGVTEPRYVFLYDLYSANLSCLDIWVVA